MEMYTLGDSDPLFIDEFNTASDLFKKNDNRDYGKPRGRTYCVTQKLTGTNVKRGIRSHQIWEWGHHWVPDFNLWFKDEGWFDVWHSTQGMAGFDHYRLGDTSRFRKLEIYDRWANGVTISETSRETYTRAKQPRALVSADLKLDGCANSVTQIAKSTSSGEAKCVTKPTYPLDAPVNDTTIQEGYDGNFYYVNPNSVLVFSFY
jgi:hypothetical protein